MTSKLKRVVMLKPMDALTKADAKNGIMENLLILKKSMKNIHLLQKY